MAGDLNIFLIDDHPMTVDSYINLLLEIESPDKCLNFITCYDCRETRNNINVFKTAQKKIDLAIIDINLPPCEMYNLHSGIDLAVLIRKEFPKAKIIMLTMHNEPVIIDRISKVINPEGLLSKNDINFETFSIIVKSILDGEYFVSKTILESQRELFKINVNWDNHDNQILMLLSQGVKNIDLPKYIPLSMSAIEKRKARIKEQLLLGQGKDKDLIDRVKKMGLL